MKKMKSMYHLFLAFGLLVSINARAQRTMFGSNNNYELQISPPVISTTVATAITEANATSGGTITSDGGAPVTSRGLVWGTSPGSSMFSTTAGEGIGTFSANLTGLSLGTTYYVRAFATNRSGTSYGSQVSFTTISSLKLHYDTNNSSCYSGTGSTLTDLSGNGNHGTLENSPSFSTLSPTAGGSVLSFNGTNQYISTNYKPANTWSISIWVKNIRNYTDNGRGIFSTYDGSFTGSGMNGIYMATYDNSLNLSYDNNTGYNIKGLPGPLNTNQWYNITATSDALGSGTIKVYLNGVKQSTTTAKTTHASVLHIGTSRYDRKFWEGLIGSVMVYNSVLSDSDVSNNYNSQKTRFGY